MGLPPFARIDAHEAGPRLVVEVLALEALLNVERQILGRGLLLPIDEEVQLGGDLDVCILFPNVGHEIWFFGRVVYVSAAGVAIDIQPTVHDKARWLEAATAFRSKTPFARAPGAMPYTEPPRLRATERRHAPEPPRTDVARPGTGVRKRRQLDAVSIDNRREVREATAGPRRPTPSQPVERPPSRNRQPAAAARIAERRAARAAERPSPPGTGPARDPQWRRPATGNVPPPGIPSAVAAGVRHLKRKTVPKVQAPAAHQAPAGFYGARFTQQLEVREIRLTARNKFALFGLHWSAYPARIEDAYEREKALLDPKVVPSNLLALHGARIHTILEAYEKAWDSLRYRASRRAHRAVIVSEDALDNAVAHYLEQGRTANLRGDREHALDCLRRVIDMNPKDSEATELLSALGAEIDTDV